METYRLVCEMIKKAMLSRNPDAVVPECNKKKVNFDNFNT
jgi:hypothetical protein